LVCLDAPLEKALRVGRLDHRCQVRRITRRAAPWIDVHLEPVPVVSPRGVVNVAVGLAAMRAPESGRPATPRAVIHGSPPESRQQARPPVPKVRVGVMPGEHWAISAGPSRQRHVMTLRQQAGERRLRGSRSNVTVARPSGMSSFPAAVLSPDSL
jgi:hypothetical protein